MADEEDTLTILLAQIGAAFAPLGDALESAENFELYARELGWSVASIPQATRNYPLTSPPSLQHFRKESSSP